jgi:hypothetical protein
MAPQKKNVALSLVGFKKAYGLSEEAMESAIYHESFEDGELIEHSSGNHKKLLAQLQNTKGEKM